MCDTHELCAPPDTESHASLSVVVAPHSKCPSQDNDVLCTVAVDKLPREWLLEVASAVIWAVLLCSVVCPVCVLLFLFFLRFDR